MKKLRWQILVVVLTLIVVGVLLLIHQPSINPNLPQPASGGTYTEALVGSFSRLNPLLDLNNSPDRDIDRLIFSSLIHFDSSGIPHADLAESWAVSSDGTIYNFTIRANANWQDGTPVTSDDVIFTLNLLHSQYSAYSADVRSLWDSVQITRLDDKNIKFVLSEPFVPFLDYLTFGVLPKHLLENSPADQLTNSSFNLAPIGSGPYQLDHLIIENGHVAGVALTVSKTYYGSTSHIDQIVFRYFPTPAAAMDAYRQGDVQGISQLTADILPGALTDPSMSVYSSRLPRLTIVLLNLKNNAVPFFQDRNIRHALMSGLNRQWMVDNLLSGQAIIANSPILNGTWAYYDGVQHSVFDTDAAAAALNAAGYVLPPSGTVRAKDKVSLSFTMVYPDDSLHTQLARAIQQNWAAIGVDVKIQPVSYDSLMTEYLASRNYQVALVDLDMARTYDPDPYPFWDQAEVTGGQNYSQWDDRTASEYIEAARVNSDPNVRLRLYRNFQVIFARELPALPLYYPIYSYGVDQRVQGIQVAPLFEPSDRFNNIVDWYLVTSRALQQTLQPTTAHK
jgi:peptide/nickel transport system substrate-binding protein